jgi:hypothetical protein
MDARFPPSLAYQPPTVADYGTLAQLTADQGMLMPFGVAAAVSTPITPQPPGGPNGPGVPAGPSSVPGGGQGPEGGTAGGLGGAGGGGGGGTAGENAGGGGGGGFANPVDTGSGGGGLPFTGFPAAAAAALGALMAGSGAALRRKLSRKRVG